jgi:hypothetical protein
MPEDLREQTARLLQRSGIGIYRTLPELLDRVFAADCAPLTPMLAARDYLHLLEVELLRAQPPEPNKPRRPARSERGRARRRSANTISPESR